MVKLETVARLLHPHWSEVGLYVYRRAMKTGDHIAYDTDANASRELLAYVGAKDKRSAFQIELWTIVLGVIPLFEPSYEQEFDLVNATPQQIYDAFCATFARELAELEKQS